MAFSILTSSAPGFSRAQDVPSRLIDEQTLVVVRFDLERLDPNATAKWLGDALGGGGARAGDAGARLTELGQRADAAVQALRKAGAKHAYLLVSLADLPARGPAPGFVAVPVAQGSDARAVADALTSGQAAGSGRDAWKADTIDDWVVAGSDATLARLRKLQPADRPEVEKVLAGADAGARPTAAIVAAVVPTDDMRKVVEQTAPRLPEELGGAPSTVLTRGARWARVALDLPPAGALRVTVQSEDVESAKALGELARKAVAALAKVPGLREAAGGDVMDRFARTVRPRVEQDRVVVALDRQGVNDLAPPFAAGVAAARRKAALVQSANRMRQLLLGCILYADAHDGQFPATLEDAAKAAAGGDTKMAAAMLSNPRGAGVRYEYVKPAARMQALADVSQTLLMYEKADAWQGPAVLGFADGHVVTEKNEAEFRKRVDAAAK